MKFTLAVAAMAGSAFALPSNMTPRGLPSLSSILGGIVGLDGCLTQNYANKLVASYAAVIAQQNSAIGTPSVTAAAITESGYFEQSDSANSLAGIPLGQNTVPSQAAFVSLSQSSPPVTQNTISIYVAGCNQIIWQWVQPNFGNGLYEVKGYHLFYVDGSGKLIKTYFEFNSLAAAYDLGDKCYSSTGAALPAL